MAIEKLTSEKLPMVVDLLKSFYPEHNIFGKDDNEIVEYLASLMGKAQYQGIMSEVPMYAYFDGEDVKGFLALIHENGTLDGKHRVWKYRHLAFNDDDVGKELVTFAEQQIMDMSATAKVELTISETEAGHALYCDLNYEEEGKLDNHYRWGETTYVLSKSFGQD